MILSDKAYAKIRVTQVTGRYVTNEHIQEFLSRLSKEFAVEDIGLSVQQNKIQSITFGQGPKRILMWSQMHGNEATTTKAILDFLKLMQLQKQLVSKVLEECTFKIIPILNPDGAKAYTRVNANGIDLNRDAQDLSQPESQILRKIYQDFEPHYCFNLHDQRTIFNVGETQVPATVSFLAPAFDVERNISSTRATSMLLIAAMNSTLQTLIPGQVGRYDDSFNPNCVGDVFQMSHTPTILFEAGHFPHDYEREETRKFIFHALLTAVDTISNDSLESFTIEDYTNIPDNNKFFCDILVKNAESIDKSLPKASRMFVLYKEVLQDGMVLFKPIVLPRAQSELIQFGHLIKDVAIPEDVAWLAAKGILELIK